MKASLSGSLTFMSLVDLLQLLGSNGSSGVLRVESKYASVPGTIYFSNGNPIDASNGKLKGLDALFSLFGWTEGEFFFTQDKIERKKVITNSRMEVILDGLKKLDDGQIEKLGPEAMVKNVTDASGKSSLPLIKGPLIDYSYIVDEEEYNDGANIVSEGKHGSWIWVILDGVVDIVRQTSKGPLTIVKIGSGAFIGSMASFLFEGHVRSATAVACGKVQLGVLDSQRISSEYAKMSSNMKGIMRSLESRQYEVTDRLTELHQGQNRLNEFVQDRKVVIKQGSEEQKLFRITAGKAFIVRTVEKIQSPLVMMKTGDHFGCFPFVDMGHEPFSASVYGTENLEAEEMDLERLQSEYDRLSTSVKHVFENMATNISVSTMRICESNKTAKAK